MERTHSRSISESLQRREVWDGGGQPSLGSKSEGEVTYGTEPRTEAGPYHAGVSSERDGRTERADALEEEIGPAASAFGLSTRDGDPLHTAPSWRMSLPRMIRDVETALLERDRVLEQLAIIRESRTGLDDSLNRVAALTDGLELPTLPAFQQQQPSISAATAFPGSGSHLSGAPVSRGGRPLVHRRSEPSLLSKSVDTTRQSRAIIVNFREDLQKVRRLEDQLAANLDSLSNAEFRLKQTQEALLAALRDPETATQIVHQRIGQPRVPYQHTESSREASNVPSVVQQYFDKIGDIGIWLERREEIQDAWDEGRAEREFIADRGDALEVPDEVFNANYEERLAYIDRELKAVQNEAEHLKHQCTADGYDPERWRTRRHSFSTIVSSDHSPDSRQRSPSRSIPDPDAETAVDSAMTTKSAQAIGSWLRTVPESDAGMTELINAAISPSGLAGDASATSQGPPEIVPIQESPPVSVQPDSDDEIKHLVSQSPASPLALESKAEDTVSEGKA